MTCDDLVRMIETGIESGYTQDLQAATGIDRGWCGTGENGIAEVQSYPTSLVFRTRGVTMGSNPPSKPSPPDLPSYVIDPLESQSPDRLERIAAYATELAAWKRVQNDLELERKRTEEEIGEDEHEELEEREISTDPADYDDVPASGAYITVKETKPGYHYYYWQWREGNSWENEYIAPVNPKQ